LQLGFVLILVNKSIDVNNTFLIRGNVIQYSLIKYKQVTQSVLALEIYSIVNSFNISIAIATTLRIIIERLSILAIPLVIYTDLYSLYKYLIKLKTIKEKRLIINIIALR
jgi:hypothetical protein